MTASVTHKAKTGSLLTGAEWESATEHQISIAPSDIAAADNPHGNTEHTTTGTPGTSAVGDSAAQGASASVARLDHTHGREGFGAVTAETTLGGASANGSAATLAHSDHQHGNPDSTAGPDANITVDAAGAAGTVHTAARSGHGHQVTTTDAPSGANITIDAAPSAAATGNVARAGHGHQLATSANTPAAIGTAAAGTSGHAPSRDNHVHATGAGTPTTSAVGDAAATGSGPAAAMTDHTHGREAFGTSAAAIGTSAAGSATTPSRSDHVHATGAGTPSTQAFGDAAATGSGPAAAMTDHKHGMPANPIPSGTSNPGSPNTNDRFFRTDLGLEIYYDGTRWLTTTLYTRSIGSTGEVAFSATTGFRIPTDSDFDLWLDKLEVVTFCATINAGTNFWTFQLFKFTAAGAATQLGSTFDDQGDTTSTYTQHKVALGLQIARATYPALEYVVTKTGAPAATYCPATLYYRRIVV